MNDSVVRALTERFVARKVVRDLLWTATSPHLISADAFPVLPVAFGHDGSDAATACLREWLTSLDVDPAPLIAFLQDKTKERGKALALGVYFASLLEFWLQYCPLLRVVQFERGKQIVSASNQTLGQLKFLFRVVERDDELDDYHVECSVKFFLLHPLNEHFQNFETGTQSDHKTYPLEQFVGPHLGENLAWRVQEVARKLELCRGESVQRWLHEHYSDRVMSRMVLKGYLFYPLHHFASTSEVSRGHDWMFHLNPTGAETSQAHPHPSIGAGHLRGWWASDLEHEFASRVRANDVARLGESRFVVLPKLLWLTHLVAETHADDGRVIVEGEDELHIETVEAITLDELLVYARSHFAALSDSPETQAKRGVVMPLLVAELIRCRSEDIEFDLKIERWKELSRGFLLDPKSWDPLPLCHAAVRYKRTNDEDHGNGEREYEGRKDWIHDGVIKPSDEEAERARQRRLHVFDNAAEMPPETMCIELLELLAREQKTFTHANLKQSVQTVFASTTVVNGARGFLLTSLQFLVNHEDAVGSDPEENASKLVQRVAHLLLDAFEGLSIVCDDDNAVVSFVALFDDVAQTESRWNYLNVTLRALAIVTTRETSLVTNAAFIRALDRLMAKHVPRWNAVAVEIVRVVFAEATSETVASLRHDLLSRLVAQHDWKHAEQLVMIACAADVALAQTLYKQFSARNMTKPLKRLRKALRRAHESQQLDDGLVTGTFNAAGSPVDLDANRVCVNGQIPPLQWTLADTPERVDAIVAMLTHIVTTRRPQPTIIGLDCEWRPQFLIERDELSADGVSLYQLAIDDHVFVVDVQVVGAVAAVPLACIWDGPPDAFLLVGFCVTGDVRRLAHSFPTVFSDRLHRFIELKQLALDRHVPAGPWGLSQLYDACFHEAIDKEEQCSDWGLRPLSEHQLVYAARDAYAVRNIALLLLADVEHDWTEYVERYVVGTNDASLGHWLTPLAPLDETNVQSALEAFGLSDIAASLFVLDHKGTDDARRLQGVIVKTIAMTLRPRTGSALRYAAIVLRVDRSIDMDALAQHFNVHNDDLQLADPETLARVFGYARGSIGPIGLRHQHAVHVVVDAALLAEAAVLPGAGRTDLTYAIAPQLLVKTVDASVAALTREQCDLAKHSLH